MLPSDLDNIEPVFDPTIETRLIAAPEPDVNAQLARLTAKLARLEAERKQLKPQIRLNTRLTFVGLIMLFVASLSFIPKDTLDEYQERIKEAGQFGIGLVSIGNLIYESLKDTRLKEDEDRDDSDKDQGEATTDAQQ